MVALVLLGAGASFGSNDVLPYPPPLGNGPQGLFARLAERGGLASLVPVDMKNTFTSDFEAGMAAYYEYADGDIMGFQRQLAEYLASFQPGSGNLYRQLIERVGPKRAIYSTLNYDLLIEQSAASLGLNSNYSKTLRQNCIRLLKPHGSSNFWPDIPLGMVRGLTVKRNGVADVAAPVLPLSREKTLYRCVHDDSLAPAIAMYAEGKPVRVCPDYVAAQQAQWAELATDAKRIFVSGVRVHSSDTHIWGTLARSDASVFYYGLGADRIEFFKWKNQSKKSKAYYIEADFAAAVDQVARQLA